MVLGLDPDSSKWICVYFPVSWLTQFGHGLVTTVVGPTQPYLAKNTGVDIATINLVWTFGFFGYMVGSLATSFVFKEYIKSEKAKLSFLAITICITGIIMFFLPFTSSFALLVIARLVQIMALGAFCTADASLIVYLLGPEKSRPFTMAFHALIGAGFLAATFLVRPFLPDSGDQDTDEICGRSNSTKAQNGVTVESTVADDVLIPTIAWPFIISGAWCVIFSIGFLILARLPYKMPRFYDSDDAVAGKDLPDKDIKYWKLFLVVVFFYYFISCGIERIYQPMAFTFGICGPLALAPRDAVVIDSCYNGGFMFGRLVSALIAAFVTPRNMILMSLALCIGAAIFLCIHGGSNAISLYVGTAVLGFFISWQFGSCFSWVAKKKNITGRLSSIFFIGCGFGSLVTPPLSGFFFTSIGPMSIIYLTLGFCILQSLLFLSLWSLARIPADKTSYNLQQIH
eukprot:TRINITY_DN11674_c0_g1_i1.p1 TRINITY_DN11674_c0_g1~~TRINITY_DN11674_c0_g1_i1.p1  ORF type:complete len:456 (-),score=102.67 TRINITY_DN11674_c0_g1_i1:161-1528(-)